MSMSDYVGSRVRRLDFHCDILLENRRSGGCLYSNSLPRHLYGERGCAGVVVRMLQVRNHLAEEAAE
jgi:hypothetical protein